MTEEDGPRTSDLGPRPEPDPEASPNPSPSSSPSPAEDRGPRTEAPERDSAPILPNAYDDAALRDAIGSPPKPRAKTEPSPYGRFDDDEPHEKKRSRKTIVISAIVTLVGLAIAALVFLGRANAERYLVVCNADHVSAEQGRAFPPWGSHPINGPEWRAITLPPNAECKPKETDDDAELAKWYLELLVDRASTTLTSRDLLEQIPKAGIGGAAASSNPLDLVAAQLEQALLLARAPERRDQRKEIERLQGDVEYWRAAARARDAAAALADAAKQFDTAAAKRPRHVDDAAAWATFSRKVADELHAGPNGAPAAPPLPGALPAEPHTPAPMGAALPVEPPPEGSDANAAAAPPDAGIPSGGVLL